jgi:hypothetical protein
MRKDKQVKRALSWGKRHGGTSLSPVVVFNDWQHPQKYVIKSKGASLHTSSTKVAGESDSACAFH